MPRAQLVTGLMRVSALLLLLIVLPPPAAAAATAATPAASIRQKAAARVYKEEDTPTTLTTAGAVDAAAANYVLTAQVMTHTTPPSTTTNARTTDAQTTKANGARPIPSRLAAALSTVLDAKSRAVDAERTALIARRQQDSLDQSRTEAEARLKEADDARARLKLLSARLAEQRKVTEVVAALAAEVAARHLRSARAGSESEAGRTEMLGASEAKAEGERLASIVARKVLRAQERAQEYDIRRMYYGQISKAAEAHLPAVLAAENIADAAVAAFILMWKKAAAVEGLAGAATAAAGPGEYLEELLRVTSEVSTPGADSLQQVAEFVQVEVSGQSQPVEGGESGRFGSGEVEDAAVEELAAGEMSTIQHGVVQQQGLRRKEQASQGVVLARDLSRLSAEEAVVRALLDDVRAALQERMRPVGEARDQANQAQKEATSARQRQEDLDSDAEYAGFQLREAEKDLRGAQERSRFAADVVVEQEKIVQEAAREVERVAFVESKEREGALEVVEAAKRVMEEVRRKAKLAKDDLAEMEENYEKAVGMRDKAVAAGMRNMVEVRLLEKRMRVAVAGFEEERRRTETMDVLVARLKKVVLRKHEVARKAKRAWDKFAVSGNMVSME